MKKVLILANHFITIYAYRQELVKELLKSGNAVYLAVPKAKENSYFSNLGCEIIETPLNRRGTNPVSDIKLLCQYIKIIRNIKPDVLLSYTIKPNIYGGIAARVCKANAIHTVTGLGSVYIQDMWQKKLVVLLNKIAFKSAKKIVFLNSDNKNYYQKLGIINDTHETIIVPGSGVNLKKFKYKKQPRERVVFTFIGRILKDKGIEEYISVAEKITSTYRDVEFEVVGFVDDEKYSILLEEYADKGVIKYLGKRDDIPEIIANSSCIVLPSYGEGRGTVLQEGAAVGRPLITCDTYGCRDNVEDGYNGYLCEVRNAESLKSAVEKFVNMSISDRLLMGKRSREKAEKEFDRQKVVETYIKEINKVINQ